MCVWEKPKTPHFYDFGIWGRALELQNHLISFLETQDTFKHPRTIPKSSVKKISFEISKSWRSKRLRTMEKAGAVNPDDPFNEFLKILDMGSISSRQHEMEYR